MADYQWPTFTDQPLADGRTWSATHDSYDQYRDLIYYAVRLSTGEAFTAMLAIAFVPDFESALRTELAACAAQGVTNTPYVAYALR